MPQVVAVEVLVAVEGATWRDGFGNGFGRATAFDPRTSAEWPYIGWAAAPSRISADRQCAERGSAVAGSQSGVKFAFIRSAQVAPGHLLLDVRKSKRVV
jgi:hypothetical protein